MAAFSHTGGNSGSSGKSGSSGGLGGTGPSSATQTSGPTSSTSNTSSNSSQSGGSKGSSSMTQSTTGSKSSTTNSSGTRTTNTKNMDDQSLAALQALIKQLAGGGSEEDRARMDSVRSEIGANQAQRGQYSKGAAFSDAENAAAAQMTNALKKLLPTITAGIDAAGTSGSAMAALLSTEAAEATSRNAAQLKLDAAISYGQIANQASGVIAELLKIDNPANRQLLEALGIAKGAVTSTVEKTNQTSTTNDKYSELINRNEQNQSTNWSNTNTNTTQNNSQGPQTVTTNTSGTNPGGWQNPTPPPKTGGGWQSPSSYNSNNTGGNYFFGAI